VLTGEIAAPAEYPVGEAQLEEVAGELQQLLIDRRPVKPCDLVVLTIGVVVAALSAPKLIAARQQWNASREKQGGKEGSLLTRPQFVDAGVVGRPLGPAVPGAVVVA